MNCIACRRPLDGDHDEPHGALIFTSAGNYGSTLFDTMGGHWLRVIICDDCVQAATERGEVQVGTTGRQEPPTYAPFDLTRDYQ